MDKVTERTRVAWTDKRKIAKGVSKSTFQDFALGLYVNIIITKCTIFRLFLFQTTLSEPRVAFTVEFALLRDKYSYFADKRSEVKDLSVIIKLCFVYVQFVARL